MYPHLTVFETLMLSAHFFLPEELSDEEKTSIVNAVIAELGLIKAKDTIIGDEKVNVCWLYESINLNYSNEQ